MVKNTLSIQKSVREFVDRSFPSHRVLCLLTYGSSLASSENEPRDCDFLLLLDKYENGDYEMVRNGIRDSKVEIFLDYWDQILRKGFDNYQRGRHGSYFFACLSEAKCLLGKNLYEENLAGVSRKSIDSGLLYRIEEYFYRIQKEYINSTSSAHDISKTKKYLSRICMDLLLYSGEMSFSDLHTMHYIDVVREKVPLSKIFDLDISRRLVSFFEPNSDESLMGIIERLNLVYLNCFDDYKNKHLNTNL